MDGVKYVIRVCPKNGLVAGSFDMVVTKTVVIIEKTHHRVE